MAEMAPLTTAHAHARKAARETQLEKWNDAAEEHGQAAADFAKALRGTADPEALRILRLLEEQHLRLARSSRIQSSKPAAPTPRSTSTTSPPSRSPALAQEMASRRGIPHASQNPQAQGRGTKAKPQTQEEMELENVTLKQTLEGLVGKINSLEDQNAKDNKELRKYQKRWDDIRRSAQEKERMRREAKQKEPPAGE